MTNVTSVLGFGILVLLFGMPIALTNVPSHALTQSMVVVLGFMIMMADDGGDA